MPTPIGHALAGLVVSSFSIRRSGPTVSPLRAGVLVFCAVAPDLDLLLRLVDGANHHRGASHSLGMAALAGLAGSLLGRFAAGMPSGLAISAAWASHVLLDYLGLDTSPPAGEMALWPLSTDFYISPVALFYDVRRAFSLGALSHNAIAAAIELVVMLPILAMCWRYRGGGGVEKSGEQRSGS